MGYDLKRIRDEVDEELKCGICHQLLENPVILSECDHIFCRNCLDEWLTKYLICPIDRKFVNNSHIKSAPKLFQNFITKFEISCDFIDYGCKTTVKVDKLVAHVSTCPFNPKDALQNKPQEIVAKGYQSKQLESLESRVKRLENENQLIRKQLDDFKRLTGFEMRKSENTCGKILVKINDKTLVIDANPNDTINQIKEKVQQLVDIKADELLVFFANQELDENRTLVEYRINKLSNLLFLSMVKKKMNISVKIDREREYLIQVSPKDRIEEILPKVLRKEVLESNDTVVSYRNQQLDERRTLFSYKIREGNYIFVNTKPRFGQTLFNIS